MTKFKKTVAQEAKIKKTARTRKAMLDDELHSMTHYYNPDDLEDEIHFEHEHESNKK